MIRRFFVLQAIFCLLLVPVAGRYVGAQALPSEAPGEATPTETAVIPPGDIWFARYGTTNVGWIDLGDGVMVVDTSGTEALAQRLLAEIKDRTGGKPIKWVVLTHLHGDSNNGLPALRGTGATILCHQKVFEGLLPAMVRQGSGRLQAIGVSDRVRVAGTLRTVDVIALPAPAHTDHDVIVHVPDAGVVFLGDLLTPGRCPMMSDPSGDAVKWLAALDTIDALKPKIVLPTRGNGTGAEAIPFTRDYIDRTLKLARTARENGETEAQLALALARPGGTREDCPRQLDTLNVQQVFKATPKAPPAQSPAVPVPEPKPKPKK